MESTDEKIQQLQLLEQNLSNFLMQRQQFQLQLIEIDSALEELKGKKTAYKIIGNIMVATSTEELEKELMDKKKTSELRVSSMEKQEERLKEKSKALRTEVLQIIQDQKKKQ